MSPDTATLIARCVAVAGIVMVLALAISAGAPAVVGRALDRWHKGRI